MTQTGRGRLTRDRVLAGAVEVADDAGIGALTMRALADHLGVKPMALYHHVAHKDEILDGIVDLVFGEIELPIPGGDWADELRRRARSARTVLRRHPWAIGLLENRVTPGPATLRHHDAVLGTLRQAGFSVAMTAHAYALLDAYVYGFVVQEISLPFEGQGTAGEVAQTMLAQFPADRYPHLMELMTEHAMRDDYDFGDEFDYGLDLVIGALSP
ncbi:AcrR family transcriptional regulator [Jiangella mangrovi]|uniref:AcrR family transcriptional regulator n=1 Tax=Jiangella mangrovi TaxID=1524084 RepID=A0A7W9LJQ4_9ACTN|nr:AcrR family transcriptional regulator [Jiangella mangrovi]